MKISKFVLTAICLLPFSIMAQVGYTITGKLSTLNVPAKAYLITLQNRQWKETDSIVIKGGKFRFIGKVDEPQQVIIAIRRPSGRRIDDLTFYLENSNITLTGKDSIKNAVVSGSVSDKENRELDALTSPYTDKIIKLQAKFPENHETVSSEVAKELKIASDSIRSYTAQIRNLNLRFIESHPNSFVALYQFNYLILSQSFKPAEVSPMFYKFSPTIQSTPLGKLAIDRIVSSQRRGLGVKIIDFSQKDMQGNDFNITSLRGKYVFIDFWASWCYWCRAENPNVLKAYQELKGKNIEFVSVSFDESRSAWENAAKEDKLPWLQVSDLKGMNVRDGLAAKLDINAIPQNLLISPEGVIVGANLRGADLPAKLAALNK